MVSSVSVFLYLIFWFSHGRSITLHGFVIKMRMHAVARSVLLNQFCSCMRLGRFPVYLGHFTCRVAKSDLSCRETGKISLFYCPRILVMSLEEAEASSSFLISRDLIFCVYL